MEMKWKWNREIMASSYINIWKWKWNGMEMEMEMELAISGMEFPYGKNYEFHTILLPFHSTQFHSFPWNSTFHSKTPTSAPPLP